MPAGPPRLRRPAEAELRLREAKVVAAEVEGLAGAGEAMRLHRAEAGRVEAKAAEGAPAAVLLPAARASATSWSRWD